MPELPDIETFKNVLITSALRKTIERVVVSDKRILGKLPARTFVSRLEGARLVAARRYGKNLLANINSGGWLYLHFGITGALHFVPKPEEETPFTRVRLDFVDDGSLAYTNKRMIGGRVGLVDDATEFIAAEKLGPDALDPRFDFPAFEAAVLGVKRDVKSVLMDQEVVAGVGNIYSDDILLQARINPTRRMDKLSPIELRRLFSQMRKVLETAIAAGAGSEQYVDRMPESSILLERKKGGHCPRCRASLEILKIGGRKAYYCPQCQNC